MFLAMHLRLVVGVVLATALYFSLISVALYSFVSVYFGYLTDQALRETLASEYVMMNLALPEELVDAENDWSLIDGLDDEQDDEQDGAQKSADNDSGNDRSVRLTSRVMLNNELDPVEPDDIYDDTGISIIPLDTLARIVANESSPKSCQRNFDSSALPDHRAVQVASVDGSDLRTLITDDGDRIRLLTHRLPPSAPVAFLQISREITAEEMMLKQLLLLLVITSSLFVLLSAVLTWWIAGLTMRPIQQTWTRQQTYLSNTSHELRMPLTLIRASTEVVLRKLEADHAVRHLLNDVLSETIHMSKLSNDMLLLSLLDVGQLKLDQHRIQMSELLPQLQAQIAAFTQERGVALCIKRAEGEAWADSTRLRQILLNVLDNALQHTPTGGTITIDTCQSDAKVFVAVEDTGEGISEDALPHVFERFYRAANNRGNKRSAGLGLAIAEMLTKLHGGEMSIVSQVGVGTRVTIAFPAWPPKTSIGYFASDKTGKPK